MGRSTALLTDHYELTMVDAALVDGTVERPCVFELFARRLPPGRRYGVVAGTERAIEAILDFRFTDAELAFLDAEGIVSEQALRHLEAYRFSGDVHAYDEGELYFAGSPVMTVVAPFGEAVVLETVLLSILNHDSAVASAAARMVQAAQGRGLLEFGTRRTHEDAAVAAARAAYLTGFDGTSNLEAGRTLGIPTLGTAAHAFTMAHEDEASAFAAQVERLGVGTTLLVDTYDTPRGIERAVAAAGPQLGGIRIDSGDLATEAVAARAQLDGLGATGARITVSSDLDEFSIEELVRSRAPIDAFGVGTRLVTGSGHPTAEFVYKLVARRSADGGWEGVAKTSAQKATRAGATHATRELDGGMATAEVLTRVASPEDLLRPPPAGHRALQRPHLRGGDRVAPARSLDKIRRHHRDAMAELPTAARQRMVEGDPAIPTRLEG